MAAEGVGQKKVAAAKIVGKGKSRKKANPEKRREEEKEGNERKEKMDERKRDEKNERGEGSIAEEERSFSGSFEKKKSIGGTGVRSEERRSVKLLGRVQDTELRREISKYDHSFFIYLYFPFFF